MYGCVQQMDQVILVQWVLKHRPGSGTTKLK